MASTTTPSQLPSPHMSYTPSPPQSYSQSQSSRPSTSSLPRSYKRAKSARLERGRREMSVPLLSKEMSHFSLSHSSPPQMVSPREPSRSFHMTPPLMSAAFPASSSTSSRTSHTPRSKSHIGPSRTPAIPPLPIDHTYPSTAPLPHLPSFLGSPFSSKTARGQYMYQTASTHQYAGRTAMTERLTQAGYFDQPGLEWLENSEWSPVRQHRAVSDEHSPLIGGLPQSSSRLRRGTDGSTSSMDDWSGSGTSSSSLLSLARSSMEQQSRPNIRTLWDEAPELPEEEEEDLATPSRQLFGLRGSDSAVPKSSEAALGFPDRSPKSPQSTNLSSAAIYQPSPLHIQPLSQTSPDDTSKGDGINFSPYRQSRASLSSFIPRLLSSRKKNISMRGDHAPEVSLSIETTGDEEVHTFSKNDSSEQSLSQGKSFWSRASLSTARRPMEGGDFENPMVIGLGLGIRGSSADKAFDLSRSLSSDSSGDIEASPSRPMSAKASTSMFVKSSAGFSSTAKQQPKLTRPSFPGRTVLSNSCSYMTVPRKSSPDVPTIGTLRQISGRPPLRRGITEPAESHTPSSSGLLSANSAFHTPTSALFDDAKPSPAAFASTGLVKKKSGIAGVELPRFGGDSEPVGEVKRREAAGRHGMGAGIPSPLSPIQPLPGSVRNADLSTASTKGSTTSGSTSTASSNAAYIQNAQRTRGLRRKGSTMFISSGSIGSVDMMRGDSKSSVQSCYSPATPTKPGLQGFGVSTPSPTSASFVYPFAQPAAANPLSTPPHSDQQSRPDLHAPLSIERYRQLPARVRQISHSHNVDGRGPIARASNPMLAASYKAAVHLIPETPGAGAVSSCAHGKEKATKSMTRLEKDFLVVQSLGSGSFSQVWKVRERKSGRFYAVKAGKPYSGAKNRLRQLEEVSILRQLSFDPHPNIIKYFDSWESHSRLYIRTAMAECGDLSRFLSLLGDTGGLGEARVWKTLVELADGIEHIHKHSFLHLDIKPSNILINQQGGLVIADLGMAVICGEGPEGKVMSGLSPALPERDERGGFMWETTQNIAVHTGSAGGASNDAGVVSVIPSPIIDREVEGDREYLCPEALGDEEVGKGADVFSLGIMILEAALNVVLPSNGDGWVKLRNDDFSDLVEHYYPRQISLRRGLEQSQGDSSAPILSDEILSVIKAMMRSVPEERWSLEDVRRYDVVIRVKECARGEALVEENEKWLAGVLGEDC
ncbi:hypothetical protein IAR55_003318 [Kwoniella newhampshirensis]|uniref:Protein kinase domain-containing protein n=1 Tax=Kwoniella newhampshirensis TaxID=1651941 RepID=A0AAW0YZB0_9TREE